MRKQVIASPEWERKKWEKKQKEFLERCRKEDEEDPPKNTAQKVGLFIWRMLTFPRDPKIY